MVLSATGLNACIWGLGLYILTKVIAKKWEQKKIKVTPSSYKVICNFETACKLTSR